MYRKTAGQQDKWQGEKAPVGKHEKGHPEGVQIQNYKKRITTEDGCHRQLQTELTFQAEIGVHAAPKNEIDGIQEKLMPVPALLKLFQPSRIGTAEALKRRFVRG